MLQNLLRRLISFICRHMVHDVKSQPGAVMPVIKVVSANEIDPELLSDIESQLLSAEFDDQGDPRIVLQLGGDHTAIADEETLQALDADWERATR